MCTSGPKNSALALHSDFTEVDMSFVRLLGFTTLSCGCVSGRYREAGSERESTYI